MGRKFIAGFIIFVLVYFSIQSVAEFYVDLQWFAGYGQSATFWTLVYGKFYVGLIFFLAFVAMIFGVIPWEDLGIAIEEGSTMVRVGTALFGARPSQAG